jgi:hypothetical protein
MHQLRKTRHLAFALLALTLGGIGSARADIVVITGVNNQGTYNVLLNSESNDLTVSGTVGPSNVLVDFTSTSGSGLLTADSSGQATIAGGTGNNPFTQLNFGLANDATFTRGVFNINAGTDGSVLIHVEGLNIDGGFFEDDFTVDANGQNFFTVNAINGQFIQDISLTGINGATFEDVRQVRLGGGDLVATTVPEPATALLLGLGFAGFAATAPKRRKA